MEGIQVTLYTFRLVMPADCIYLKKLAIIEERKLIRYLQDTCPSSLDLWTGVLIKHGRGVSQTAIKPTKAIWTSRKLHAYSICCRRLSLPGVAEVEAGRSLCSAAEPDQFRPSLKTHLVLVDPVKRSGLPTGWFICVRVCNIVAL